MVSCVAFLSLFVPHLSFLHPCTWCSLFVLTFLAVLYLRYLSTEISSRAIDGKPIISYLRKFRPLVTMDARIAYNIGRNIHIHNKLFYLSTQKMIYEHIAVLWLFFTWWVSLQFTPFKHIRFTSCFHRVFVDAQDVDFSSQTLTKQSTYNVPNPLLLS